MNRAVEVPPNLMDNFERALDGLSNECLALVTDFDGTLSEFVPVLENAVIHPDAFSPLCRLAARLRLTAVMSGRAAQDVERRVGLESVTYIGNHGAEQIEGGVLRAAEGVEAAESHLQELLHRLACAADDPGLVLENKRYSASLHFRTASDEAGVVKRLRATIGAMLDHSDFEFYWGNKILEIRRRNGVNKGIALDRLIRDRSLDRVIFLGDDTTDADALRVLRNHKLSGNVVGIGIAVIQDGTPDSVLENADFSLNGVPEVAAFLSRLDAAIG